MHLIDSVQFRIYLMLNYEFESNYIIECFCADSTVPERINYYSKIKTRFCRDFVPAVDITLIATFN